MNQSSLIDTYPLSPMQQGMLFHYLKEPHSGVDIEQIVVHLPEAIASDRLEKAWQWLVRRHDILRTRFVWEDSETQQEVLPDVAVPFVVEDARRLSKTDQGERLKSFLQTDRVRGFDLRHAPMLRLTLFQWDKASFSLVWTFHHALLDGRSYPVVLREVFEAYAELGTGAISERPQPFAYRRYIEWLRQEKFDAAESFWKKQLAGFTAATPLVVDHPSSADGNTYQQGEAWEKIDSIVTTELRKLAQIHNLTLNSIVMGAWAMLLHRYSREEDIVFAATRACRRSSVPDAAETIGLFINTVPVRVRIKDDDALISVFKDLRKLWLEMRPYEHTPLTRVKAVSQVPPSQPLFETLLVFENYRLDTVMRSLGGVWASREVELHELTNFPITLAAYDGEELAFKIEFDRRRLDDAAIRRMLGHLRRVLEGVRLNPRACVGDLPLLTDVERKELVEERNFHAQTHAGSHLPLDGGATLHQLFEDQVTAHPEEVALTCDGISLTYAQLNTQANRLARHLLKYGVKRDALVGLCLDRTEQLMIAILAILKAGGAYLPIDLAYPADRLAFMLEDSQAPVVLTQSKLTDNFPRTRAKLLCIDEILAHPKTDGKEENLPSTSAPDDLAYVIYTSGTTGKPKGSLITHRNVTRLFAATQHWFAFDDRDVWTLFHSCAFDFSVWEMWGALLYGGRLVVVPFLVSRSPEAFYELLAKERVTVLNQTPSAFRQLIQAEESIGQKDLALRYIIFGGEALEMQTLRPWFGRHGDQKPTLVNMYGITETTVHVTYRPLSKEDLKSGSVIGEPVPDLRIYILDPQRQPVPIGVPGEMYVGGAGLARGYLHRPELTAERFIADHLTGRQGSRLYKTGDLARFLPGHDIEYLGRIDDQVKIRGFRIELGEIESVLSQHPSIRQSVVLAREDEPGAKRLVAYLVATPPVPEVSALREHLKKQLPEYMIPAVFVFLDKLPLTNNGKVDRKALPIPEQQRPELAGRYVQPRTPAEEKLAGIWSKALRVERVGVNDNFFELGGDSILSIQIISAARREGLQLTPTLLFAHQTIAELAAAASALTAAPETLPTQGVVAGSLPLTPIQKWFVEQHLEEPQHYNQAFLFEVSERMERRLLEDALMEVSCQHDALRLRFVEAADGWLQSYSALDESALLTWTDLSRVREPERTRTLETATADAEASLNLQNGPLWRVAYFDLGATLPGRLLLVIHHLAIDGISWRPLLEDLESAYRQLKAGQKVKLAAKTTSYKAWAERLSQYSKSEILQLEAPYWEAVTEPRHVSEALKGPLEITEASAENTEGAATTLKLSLTREETRALLQNVPVAYNTQINDVLLAALLRAWHKWSGSRVLFTNLEGHGRENLFEDLDLSRTAGWFTSIFPVRLELPNTGANWQPGETLKSVKEQLRGIPQHGIGYGILRYLTLGNELSASPEPAMVFNYLGQFDQILAGSTLFRFAEESTGPWHSPKQRRRQILETNCVVRNGQLELWWTYNQTLHPAKDISELAAEFMTALKELIAHCQSPLAGGRTPSDFPLARLEQPALDDLFKQHRDIEDLYPLSPIQTLFYSANPGNALSAFDQWRCTLRGELDVAAFQRAWQETLRRHSILRSTIHGEGLREAVQVVHRDVQLPWTMEDWRGLSAEELQSRWSDFLQQDHSKPLMLTEPPAMRFALVRWEDQTWKFLWSVPALLLDGWSWPLVFRDASRLYQSFSQNLSTEMEDVRPYRDYLSWLGKQTPGEAQTFWRENLAGFKEPTPLPRDTAEPVTDGERYVESVLEISTEGTNALKTAARQLQLTLSTLVQGAWALLLSRQSGKADVVFGAAFAGRPPDLRGVESIAGPFVNNLPVRVTVDRGATAGEFFRELHARMLKLSPFQYTPLMEIQQYSEMPWRHRLFESLVVFQNYLVDESARAFGTGIAIADFVGPVHTNYPVLLLAEPGASLRLKLIYDQQTFARTTMERWVRDLEMILETAPVFFDKRVADLQALLSPPAPAEGLVKRKLRARSQNFVPPQTEMEVAIAGVWQKMFGLEAISIEENFFDLGGHSLLLIQMHVRLREILKTEFPIVTLLEYPNIRLLAGYLSKPAASTTEKGEQWRDRAQRQKQALTKLRTTLKK